MTSRMVNEKIFIRAENSFSCFSEISIFLLDRGLFFPYNMFN
jgi:hypothetical protein